MKFRFALLCETGLVLAALLAAPTGAEAARYGFETGKDTWTSYNWDPGITNVAQSSFWGYASTNSLRLDCVLSNDGDKGWAGVTFDPVNLEGTTISMRVYCPSNSSGTGQSWAHTQLRLWVKDKNYAYRETAWDAFQITNGISTQYVHFAVHGDATFDSTNVIQFGLQVYWRGFGSYRGPLYIDAAGFGAAYVPPEPPQTITNTEHLYDMETTVQREWWKWDTNPDGWHAKAWTNVYYATNQGYNGSVALAAHAVFVTNNSAEVVTNELGQVVTNEYAFQKGVFEIAYQPALNLSTKDRRILQAKIRFDPPAGDSDFVAKMYVYDKISDQWYFNVAGAGGGGWNFLQFDLDDPSQYATNLPESPSPAGPMNASEIGFVDILVFSSRAWTGTVYVDEIVVAGRETRTNYTLLGGGFVQAAGHKFVVGGSNFYHCGANIEYLQTVPDRTVREGLDWAASNHIGVVRTWAMQEGRPYSFQPQRGVWNEVMFEHLDRIVAEAGHRGIRLMLDLVDNWAHNGGVFQYVHWVVKEHPETVNTNLPKEGVVYHDQFWTNAYCKQWYRDYVTKLLTRTNTITGRVYRNDPTIFALEIVNEPRCESDFGGRTIHGWLNEMSDFVRGLDTNHILGNGEEGGYVNTYQFADTVPWEVYPDNYYHYAVYATGSSTCDLYGCGRGHGVDFLSDNNTLSTFVQWQGGFYTNQGPTNGEWRSGNSNINFCTARIYVDQKEYNVWRTNYNGADQRLEWINDHWYDAHNVIEKPMILEEFGIHAIGWVFNGSYGQVQLSRTPEYTFEDRVNVYDLFYHHIENSGISASYFWNFGFQGMWDDPFHLCEQVTPWVADTTNSAATGIVTWTNQVIQGAKSLKLSWDVTTDHSAVFHCPTNEKWLLRVDEASTNEPPTHGVNRTKFFWNLYNPSAGALQVALALEGGPHRYWCETPLYTLTGGWNRVLFDLSSGAWRWTSNGVVRTNYLINIPNSVSNVLEDVHQVSLVFRDLPAGAGCAYVDDVQIKRDDGFVVYSDDPVNEVIKAHALRMQARNVATNQPANHAPVASNRTVVVHPRDTSPLALAAADADGDFLSYRIIQKPTNGWVFGMPPTNLVYTPRVGAAGSDSFTYVVHDGKADSAEAVVTIRYAAFDDVRYDFEEDGQGWYANYTEWSGYAVTAVVQTAERSFCGRGSLRAAVDLRSGLHNAGDAEANMEDNPPPHVIGPVNLSGQTVSISVFCPAGARGNPANPNRIQIYAKDTSWRAEYTAEANIEEERWVTYTMTVSTNTPPGGWKADNFDPSQIRALGVRVKHGGSGSDYAGPIYIDPVSFPIIGKVLYGFSQSLESWTTESWGNGDATVAWTNVLGNPGAGALKVTPVQGTSYGKFYIKDWDLVDNQDLFYNNLLQCYVYVPADAPVNIHHAVRVRLLVRSSADGWTYAHQSQEVVLTPGRWNVVRWDLSELSADVLRDVDEFGMEIVWPNRDVWQGPVYVDSISILPGMPKAAPDITSVVAATNTVGRYERHEITVGLDHVARLNPYDPDNVDLRAVFTSPSGTNWTVNGFYIEEAGDAYGAGRFKIRFAPGEVGTWTYKVVVGNSQGTDVSSNHSFACAASDRHGWVRVSDNDGHYLEQDDDTPFIGKGYCHPWDGDDEGLFENCEEHGINMIHWWMAPWDTMLTVKPANPDEWWREKSSYDMYEQGRAAELDRVVGHAEKHNVKLVFTIWPHDAIRDYNHHKWRINGSWAKAFDHKYSEPEWYINAFSELDDPPQNQKFFYDARYKAYQDRLYRYIIARWGYSEAIGAWALVSELFGTFANSANCIDYQGKWAANKNAAFGEDPYQNMDTNQCDGADYTIPWITYINRYFKTNDPFRHPTTASYATDEYWPEGFDIVDIPQIHVYADLYNWITPPVTLSKYHRHLFEDYDKPALMGEIGTVEWKLYEPDYLRVCSWPAICSGAAITPMMWTTPAFSWFGDAKMGPWYGAMSDEMKVLGKFTDDIRWHTLNLRTADVETKVPNEPPVTLVESFESGMNNWATWGPAIPSFSVLATNHATDGAKCLRLNIDMDTFARMPVGVSGIQKYEGEGFAYNWSNYWPRGTLKMDVYIPEFYNPDSNPDGFLLGINKDPRSIIEIFTKDAGGNWHWYSTTNEYGGDLREKDGWKKLTVGMLWNLELNLGVIPSAYEAAHIVGLKFWFGDVGILRGPIYLDNIAAGLYAYNTYGMVSSNGDFAIGWIQDRTWTNGFIASNAVFQLNGLKPGLFNLEWWDTRSGILKTVNAGAPTGTLAVTVPDFNKDIAVKVRRVGNSGATAHNVAIANIAEYDYVVRAKYQPLSVLAANRGTASETFTVTLTDTTSGQGVGTNTITLGAGESVYTRFIWNTMNGPFGVRHELKAQASVVAGETATADNTHTARIKVYETTPPWDPATALGRWKEDSGNSDGRSLTVSTNHASEGTTSFEFFHRAPNKNQAYFGFDNVYENWSNRTSFVMDVYVADGSTNAELLLVTGSNWTWHYSAPAAITSGWNRDVTFSLVASNWTRAVWNNETQQRDYFYNVVPTGLEEVQQIFIKFTGYSDEGSVFVDNLRLDGLYRLNLAYANGLDLFPKATAEQSNYTGAACGWMIARYLNGESFTQSQSQIYAATSHDPAHNSEITPQSCAAWMQPNSPAGFYFSARSRTNLADALKESVYWADYLPPGGLQSPVYILCGTNWQYKVVRGFQSSAKPYDGGSGVTSNNRFSVYGVWLNDPLAGGLGYNLYATAAEMTNVFLRSTSDGKYWLVAEPPADAEEMGIAVQKLDSQEIALEPADPNPALAAFLAAKFGGGRKRLGGGDPGLAASLPDALKDHESFLGAFDAAPVVTYYAVNTNRDDVFYLAAGGESGPGSTRYVLKLATNGALLQATWSDAPLFYHVPPRDAAEWAARQQLGDEATLEGGELASASGDSPFVPAWQLQFDLNGTSVYSEVRADVDLSGDADDDGMSDGDELYAGLDPDNRLSVFSIQGGTVRSLGSRYVVIRWPSVTGRTYGVYRSDRLGQPFTKIASRVAADEYVDEPPTTRAFYKVVVE